VLDADEEEEEEGEEEEEEQEQQVEHEHCGRSALDLCDFANLAYDLDVESESRLSEGQTKDI
jgi:hypothetical protein